MAYTFIKDLTTVNYTKGNSGRKYIVIHYTGNKTDTAKANASYFRSTNRGSSAHYFVDKTTVYQVVDDNNTAWAVGRNYGSNNLFGKVVNTNSLNIEMCSDNGRIADQTLANTITLTKELMKKNGIPISKVYRHYDVCSKKCPGWDNWLGAAPTLWNYFKAQLNASASIAPSAPTDTTSNIGTTVSAPSYVVGKTYTTQVELNVRKGAGTNYSKVGYAGLTANAKKFDKGKDGAIDKGTKVTCKAVKHIGNNIWIQIPSGWIAAWYNNKIYVK